MESLSEALRKRAWWLKKKQSDSFLEYGWGDKNSVIASLLEFADVVDSWNGEYLSKEDSEHEHHVRQYGGTSELTGNEYKGDWDIKPLTMEDRKKMARKWGSEL